MHLKRLELNGFKSFAKKSEFVFDVPIIAVVGPNGSGKSNVVESIRFVLGEQSVKSMRGKTGADLVFKGSKDISQMSRASVTIVFDNTERVFHLPQMNNEKLSIDFDEVSITREVFVDGGNKYLINGHEVRMKDIHELIASVNIGASGHHIISQGEADRYLNANVKDRRELIEEALGLKVYQYRIKESLRKLDRAEKNMRESEIMRREIAPHLRFLKKQVEKIERAKGLRIELEDKYKKYFAQEDFLINQLSQKLDLDRNALQTEYQEVQTFLDNNPINENQQYPEDQRIQELQQQIHHSTDTRTELRQQLGRIEGMLTMLRNQEQAPQQSTQTSQKKSFSFDAVVRFVNAVIDRIDKLPIMDSHALVNEIQGLKQYIQSFSQETETITPVVDVVDNSQKIAELLSQQKDLESKIRDHVTLESEYQQQINVLVAQREQKRNQQSEIQREYYEQRARKKELDGKRLLLVEHDEVLGHRVQARREEYTEACTLLGEPEIHFQQIMTEHELEVTPQSQEVFRRDLERIKIRLEDMGGGSGGDIIREFKDTQERDGFLEREILDISQTIESLHTVINDLRSRLDREFQTGVKKINTQFDKFFKLMFGGGNAELEQAVIKKRRKKTEGEQLDLLEDDSDQDVEYGIDIKVKLPRKKVSDLDMLSGGERSLTSIALLFALSQVNPPPFLVLDETDAALDEANSQKYGDMIESLSEYSQLVVVTHNRETMSRAQTLFGVTLGRDDSSSVLSLRLEDAAKYAK